MFRLWWKFRPLAEGTLSRDPMNRALDAHRTGAANPRGDRP
jgi:hypothetical protein